MADNRLRNAEEWLQKIEDYGVDVAEAIVKNRSTRQAVAYALEPELVRCGTFESLNEKEEEVYDNLNGSLRLSKKDFSLLTPEQRFCAARVIVHQGYGVQSALVNDYLGITFKHIFIGIEKDGYAHS